MRKHTWTVRKGYWLQDETEGTKTKRDSEHAPKVAGNLKEATDQGVRIIGIEWKGCCGVLGRDVPPSGSCARRNANKKMDSQRLSPTSSTPRALDMPGPPLRRDEYVAARRAQQATHATHHVLPHGSCEASACCTHVLLPLLSLVFEAGRRQRRLTTVLLLNHLNRSYFYTVRTPDGRQGMPTFSFR